MSSNPFVDDCILSSLVQSIQNYPFHLWSEFERTNALFIPIQKGFLTQRNHFICFDVKEWECQFKKTAKSPRGFLNQGKVAVFDRKCWSCLVHSKPHSVMRHMSDLDLSKKGLNSRAEFFFGKVRADSIFSTKLQDETSLRLSLPKGL